MFLTFKSFCFIENVVYANSYDLGHHESIIEIITASSIFVLKQIASQFAASTAKKCLVSWSQPRHALYKSVGAGLPSSLRERAQRK